MRSDVKDCELSRGDIYLHSLKWTNPYTNPPHGMPKVIGSYETFTPALSEGIKAQLLGMWPDEAPMSYSLGCGYSWSLDWEITINRWTDERKSKARRTRAINKIKKNYPIFADQFIAELDANQNTGE